MPVPHRPKTPTGIVGLAWLTTDDGSRTLWDEGLDESFHSGCGAVAESLQVYLINSGVARQLRGRRPSSVLEVGFGTAMDFLLTAAVATHFRTVLHYTGLDNNMHGSEILRALHSDLIWQKAYDYCETNSLDFLLEAFETMDSQLEQMLEGIQLASMAGGRTVALNDYVQLRLLIGDAREFDPASNAMCQRFDAIYFDPFSPENSPDMWSESMFRRIDQALIAGGTLTTYCVKSLVRHRLTALGYSVSKLPGPAGGKREVLLAQKHALGGIPQ